MLSELTSAKSLAEAPDSTLIAASKRGQVSVFDVLVERYQARLFSVTFRITGNREDAEDVVQQSSQKAFMYLHTFEGKSSFATWLTRIAINQALMLRRSNRALKTVSLQQTGSGQEGSSAAEIPDSSANPEELYAQQEAKEILFGAMKKLNDGVQAALRLRLGERTIEETAHIMGCKSQPSKPDCSEHEKDFAKGSWQ